MGDKEKRRFAVRLKIAVVAFIAASILFVPDLRAQFMPASCEVSEIRTVGVSGQTVVSPDAEDWRVSFFTERIENEFSPEAKKIRDHKTKLKLERSRIERDESNKRNRPLSAPNLSVVKSFPGNPEEGYSPSDNQIVASDDRVVSATNSNLCVFDNDGNLLFRRNYSDLFDDPLLNGLIYDPRLIYDAGAERFLLILVHGYSLSNSRIIVCFSKTNDPVDGWSYYTFRDHAVDAKGWLDYPHAAINSEELFITGNVFTSNDSYKFPAVYQIDKNSGYAGEDLDYRIYLDVPTPDGEDYPFSLVPVAPAIPDEASPEMYMVSSVSSKGTHISIYEFFGKLSDNDYGFSYASVEVDPYEISANALMKDLDDAALMVNDCRIQNALLKDDAIHITLHGEYGGFYYNGIIYIAVDLKSFESTTSKFGETGSDLCFPFIAYLGEKGTGDKYVFSFLRSSESSYPSLWCVGASWKDGKVEWGEPVELKAGENYIKPVNWSDGYVRWGDYSGSHSDGLGGAWIAGEYGDPTRTRATWIAKVYDLELTDIEFEREPVTAKVFPNPASNLFSAEFELDEAAAISARIYDSNGSPVKILIEEFAFPGYCKLEFDAGSLSSGAYFLKIYDNEKPIYEDKIIIAR